MSLIEVSTGVFGPQTEIQITPTSAHFPEGLSKAKWLEAGRMLRLSVMAVRWWAGDWASYGKRTWGPEVQELQEWKDLAMQLEFDAIVTASCVAPEQRREGLPWTAHREVAELEKDAQEEWLQKMEKQGWDVVELRRAIRHKGAQAPIKGNAFTWVSPTKDCRDLVAWFKSTPESYWTPITRELWKKELKPIVEVYEGLI